MKQDETGARPVWARFLRCLKVWPFFLVAAGFLAAFVILYIENRKINTLTIQNENLSKALTDTVKLFRNVDGSQKATITALKVGRGKDLLKIRSSDKEIQRLQTLVKSYGNKLNTGTAATFTASTSAVATSVTTILPGDTVKIHDSVFLYPVYASQFQLGKWISGSTRASKDSTTMTVKTYDEYDVIVGENKRGLFKRSEPFADVITHSPYSSIKTLRAMNISIPPQKRIGVGASAGYGINTFGKPMIYIGLGFNYNLIQIK